MCILQLTEAGDIFYQILEPEQADASPPPAAEDEQLPQQAGKKLLQPMPKEATTSGRKTATSGTERLQPDSQLVISDTSSDEGIIEPTQQLTAQRHVAETPERVQQAQNMYSDSSSEDSDSVRRCRKLKRLLLQVVVNDPELDQVNGLEAGVKDGKVGKNNTDSAEEASAVGEAISGSSSLGCVGPCRWQAPAKLSDSTLATWKLWLQKMVKKSREKKPRPHCLQHLTIKTEGLLHLTDDVAMNMTEEDHVQSLRRDLRACMSKRSLLVHSAVSDSLGPPDVVPLPNLVDTDVWTDQLSHRLTLSWHGEKAWREWWEDHLGLNREERVEALRRKRRREKVARRAAGRCLELSGSFTSSVSYQSEMEDFSDSTGWSSAASQAARSDTEDLGSQLEDFWKPRTPRAATPSTMQTDTPVRTPTATPQSVMDKRGDQQTPSSSRTLSLSQTPKPDSTPTSQRRDKRPAKDYLSSLFAPQVRGRS